VKGRIFISGPIQGMETKQSYRDVIREICDRYGYESVDPWKRERIMYGSKTEHDWWNRVPARGFVRRDLEDIDRCVALIAYLPRLSAGTCMELFYAKLKGKKTICVCKMRNPSPWIIVHSDVILKDIANLEKILEGGL
jgi:nucleoside 2-deoxyribosyltransferase